jgi:mono/diheme cytochrome c family protein
MSCGEAEYLNSCAVCHSLEGGGDGLLGDELMKRPAASRPNASIISPATSSRRNNDGTREE